MDFAYLRQQLEHNAERITVLCQHLPDEQARFKPAPDSWSVLEVVNHLLDEEIFDFRFRLDFILAPEGKEWKPIHPGAWVTERKYNERDLDKSLANFQRERAASIAWLKSLGDVDWKISYTYEFGSMRAGDMFAAWVAHDQLHLRQLVELHRAYTEQAAKPYELSYAGEW